MYTDDEGHFLGLNDSLDGIFPNGLFNQIDQDFNCNFDDIYAECSTINTNSVDRYFPTGDAQIEFFDGAEEEVDFSKVKNEKPSSSSKKSYTKQPKQREPEESEHGYLKPLYPYSCLISLALKNSSDGQLSVSDIYSFVCENFPFFEYANPGWKNSIRHNLSLNKNFLKIEQPGGARKSCLWQFNPEKLEKVDQELIKYDENEIKKALRTPDDYFLIINGEKGMPLISRRVKTPDFGNENSDTTPKIMKQVAEYFTDATPGQKSKQTVRQVAEQALNKLLKVKSEPAVPPPRVLQAVVPKVERNPRQNRASTSNDSSNSSSSDSNYSPKEYIYCLPENGEAQDILYEIHDTPYETEYQNDENYQCFYELSPNQMPETTPPPSNENNFSSSIFGGFSLNGNPFKPFRFDGSSYVRPAKRPANPNLLPLGTIRDGQFISSAPKLAKYDDAHCDPASTKENMFV